MKEIAVVYHSGYGHTEKQAIAVHQGAAQLSNINARLIKVSDIDQHWDYLTQAHAIIFGAPTYMGSISAEFKKFMEASSKLWFTQARKNKIAGGFTNSGSLNGDKFNSLVQLVAFAAQHGMIWVSLGILPASTSKANRDDLNRLGSFIGAISQSDVDVDASVAPPVGDLTTALEYGKHIAQVTLAYNP